MHTWLFTLSQKKTNCYSLTHHTWKISPHYLVKCKTFSSDWRWCCVPTHCAEIQRMSQQDASKTRPYRGLVLDRPTHALVSLTVSTLGCTKLIFIEPGAKINGQYCRDVLLTCWRRNCYQRSAALLETRLSSIKTMRQHIVLVTQSSFCAVRHPSSPVLVASQQSWPQPGRLPRLGNAARVLVSSMNPQYRRVAEAPCCKMGCISPERGGLCSWLVAKKTGSMYPCRRWSLWTLALTLLAWHSSCHTSQPVLLRATNVWRNTTLHSVRSKKFYILQGSAVTFFRCGG